MTVRKVVTRSGGHSRGLMPSLKNQGGVAWESSWELMFYQLLELSPNVHQFIVQPTRERLCVDGQSTYYIPDVKVHFVDGTLTFFEVKPALKCRTARIGKRLIEIEKHFAETGRRFQLITDEWLSAGPRAENIVRLMFHRRDHILDYVERSRLQKVLSANQLSTINELCALVGESSGWLLLGLSIVGVDLDLPLNGNSTIFLDGGHRHADFFA